MHNKKQKYCFEPIGVIHSPHKEAVGTPIQPAFSQGFAGRVVVDSQYAAALKDIEGFERIWLIYYFDRAQGFSAEVTPYRDDVKHGLFATRAPSRPNKIGMSVVKLLKREGHILHIDEVDILDGSPLLDIKPYIPGFDAYPKVRASWLDAKRKDLKVADDRFHQTDEKKS